jgi:mortality factor 4-like protein 1
MAPAKPAAAPFSKDERVLCFHHEMLYEAKILDVKPEEDEKGAKQDGQWSYKIHYKGWKASWDDWVSQDRVRKFTDENKELASQLTQQSRQLQLGKNAAKQASKKGTGKANGSEMGSARGSEERAAGATAAATGRGPRRTRDYDLEHVSTKTWLL